MRLFPNFNPAGFRKFHSTETALLKVQNDILLRMGNKEVTLLVLLDLSAAFDTIEHSILLNVLERDFGVSGTALKWFDSFLSDCKQCVLISGKAPDDFNLNCGVPQGSCLGPVLFFFFFAFFISLNTFSPRMVMQMIPSSTSPFDLCPWNLKLKLSKFWRAVSLKCALGLYPIA